MNKKIVLGITTIIAILGICLIVFLISNGNKEEVNNANEQEVTNNSNNSKNDLEEENNTLSNNTEKVAVVYFSVTNNTEKIAEYISEVTGGKLIKIIPEQEYTSNDINYGNDNSRANKEQNDENARPKIKNKLDIDEYDTIYLGFPIWWGDTPKIILTLLDEYNLNGKTVIPFCTSGSSGISTAENTLKNYNKKMTVKSGKRFSSSSTKEDVENWITNQ